MRHAIQILTLVHIIIPFARVEVEHKIIETDDWPWVVTGEFDITRQSKSKEMKSLMCTISRQD